MKKLLDKITPKTIMIMDIVMAVLTTALCIVGFPRDDVRVPFKVLYIICTVMWWANVALSIHRVKREKESK